MLKRQTEICNVGVFFGPGKAEFKGGQIPVARSLGTPNFYGAVYYVWIISL